VTNASLTDFTVHYSSNDIPRDRFCDTEQLSNKSQVTEILAYSIAWGQTVLFGFFKHKPYKSIAKIIVKIFDFIRRISYTLNDSNFCI
jgi:hypothetical protein